MSVGDQLYVGSRHERQFDHRHVYRPDRRKAQQPPGKLYERFVLELPRVERRLDGQTRLAKGLRGMAVHRRNTAGDQRQ